MHKIVDGLIRENEGRRVPVTLFTKNGGMVGKHRQLVVMVGLDWTINIADAKARIGDKVALQAATWTHRFIYAQPERIRQEVASILEGFGRRRHRSCL